MGDWGTQTGSGIYSSSSSSSGSRKLYHDEPDSIQFLSKNYNANYNEGGEKQDGEKQDGEKKDDKKKDEQSGDYWAVLVAEAMANYCEMYPADFLIALGDNFYDNGVEDTEDELWLTVYGQVYNQTALQIPWYAIFGNHDYGSDRGAGSLQAQIDFGVYKYDNRWTAGHCYLQSYQVPNTATTVDIVFVDSTLIAPEETYMTSTSAGVSSDAQAEYQAEQLSCMCGYLAASQASFLIVAGHYPIYSTGKNAPGDMTTMVEMMYPYLEKYDVDMYLAGHDHRLEHLQYTTSSGGTMDFIISGAAGKPDNQLTSGITSSATSKFSAATGGFAFAEVSDSTLSVNMVDYTGTVLYSMSRSQSRQPYSGSYDYTSDLGSYDYTEAQEVSESGRENYVNDQSERGYTVGDLQYETPSSSGSWSEYDDNAEASENSFTISNYLKSDQNPFTIAKYGLMVGCLAAIVMLVFVASASGIRRESRIELAFTGNGDVERGPPRKTVQSVVTKPIVASHVDSMTSKQQNLRSMIAAAVANADTAPVGMQKQTPAAYPPISLEHQNKAGRPPLPAPVAPKTFKKPLVPLTSDTASVNSRRTVSPTRVNAANLHIQQPSVTNKLASPDVDHQTMTATRKALVAQAPATLADLVQSLPAASREYITSPSRRTVERKEKMAMVEKSNTQSVARHPILQHRSLLTSPSQPKVMHTPAAVTPGMSTRSMAVAIGGQRGAGNGDVLSGL
eukprot:CAMPEP_0182429262 /NCGR_PEP_ID=MMETSP1167-20130531/25635_1 /TAXON_ID=2988 /ORGANISM="Mallomonas Sp, Strain CCMP3275" /LENGTH=730 /DNA_ID=CAMNT_0024612675 /DNA_START=161 /DNA_END=2353 /DNA_ORIENTATION=-